MILKRFYIRSKEDFEKARIFEKHKLGKLRKYRDVQCKHCSIKVPIENLTLVNKFWKCPKDHNNKYNEKSIISGSLFEFDYSDILKIIYNKIGAKKVKLKSNYIIFEGKSKNVPIFFFDSPMNISIFLEGLKRCGFFIYFNEEEVQKEKTPYNKNNFMDLFTFLKIDSSKIIQKLKLIEKSSKPLKTLDIIQKIDYFTKKNSFEYFELEVSKIFNDLKLKESEIINLLDLFKFNKENPSGNKFVNVGGNFPVDIYPIELFSYFSKLLEISKDKGFDAKKFSEKLTYQTYQKKKESNSGKKLVFITSANKIEGKIWKDVIQARENTGEWIYFILDLDLLSLLLFNMDYQKYFNK